MAEHDVNIAVPRSHPRSFQQVLETLKDRGITDIDPMPAVGVIRVKVDDLSKLEGLRDEGLPVEEGRRDVGLALPGPESTPQPPSSPLSGPDPDPAPAPSYGRPSPPASAGRTSPLSDA